MYAIGFWIIIVFLAFVSESRLLQFSWHLFFHYLLFVDVNDFIIAVANLLPSEEDSATNQYL